MNMNYCKFRNTYLDLKACYENMIDDNREALSLEENEAKIKIIKLCNLISSFDLDLDENATNK